MALSWVWEAAILTVGVVVPPSLEQLVEKSDVIVTVTVDSSSANGWIIALIALGFVGGAMLAHKLRTVPKLRPLLLIGCLALSILVLYKRGALSGYQRVASCTIDSIVKGRIDSNYIGVWYGIMHACDATMLKSGEHYLLFLKRAWGGYQLVWLNHSHCVIDGDGIVPSWIDAKSSRVPLGEVRQVAIK